MQNMVNLTKTETVEIQVELKDLQKGNERYYVLNNGVLYDPELDFKPISGGQRLYGRYIDIYHKDIDKARSKFKELHTSFNPQTPTPNLLGDQLTNVFLETLSKVSVDDVLKRITPLLDNHIKENYGVLPQVIKVETVDKETKVVGAVHEEFETALKFVSSDIPVFLTGGAGTGKNVLCKQIAEALGLEFYFSNAVSQEYKLTGFIDANGAYHDTQFYKAFTQGGLFMLDEIDASIPEVLVILNAAIANRYFDFPTGRVEAHKDFRLIAAGNTFGTGADIEYTGRFQLDAASLDRFAILEIDYSENIEKAITNNNQELITFAHEFRKACEKAGIKHLFSYRSMERISKLEGLLPLDKVLKTCLLKNLQSDDLNIIKRNITTTNKYTDAIKA